jgi:hypothetical protein
VNRKFSLVRPPNQLKLVINSPADLGHDGKFLCQINKIPNFMDPFTPWAGN